jgi:tRNA G18 (ribose-2'-O)-methylase SpoU
VDAHRWRKKTVLVLGREREGVDADILSTLDHCVVIPQRGRIRSLNVHVSASIAVQRYAAAAVENGW